MQSSYIYSATRLTALGNNLLSQTDIDRLLTVAPGSELEAALKETYLAPYVEAMAEKDVSGAIDATLAEAKQLIHRLAPEGERFQVLWVQYDIHNLRIFAKANRAGKSYEDVAALVSTRGMYAPEELYRSVTDSLLNRLQIDWQPAYDQAVRHVEAGELDQVDAVFDALLFTTMTRQAATARDAFLTRYVKAVIDLYNAKATLRRVKLGVARFAPQFVSGGTFSETEINTKEGVVAALEVLAPGYFTAAIETFEASGNTTELDARVDDYLVTAAKHASVDMFSSAALVAYYLRTKQAATNLRTIMVGRNSGMSEESIRANLRTAYVNH